MMESKGWVGVDLDSTLAFYDGDWRGFHFIGDPIPAMLEQVKRWLAEGVEVRIFTARASDWEVMAPGDLKEEAYRIQVKPIVDWCELHLGVPLRVTCIKDFKLIQFFDDRCVQVEPNTGRSIIGANMIPEGEDVGETPLQIAIGQRDGNVLMSFGRPMEVVKLNPDSAIAVAQSLVQRAGEAFS